MDSFFFLDWNERTRWKDSNVQLSARSHHWSPNRMFGVRTRRVHDGWRILGRYSPTANRLRTKRTILRNARHIWWRQRQWRKTQRKGQIEKMIIKLYCITIIVYYTIENKMINYIVIESLKHWWLCHSNCESESKTLCKACDIHDLTKYLIA